MSDIRVSEIFGPTIQGEGALIGRPTVFVRTGGCDYRCRWCDTMHAVDPEYRAGWRKTTTDTVWRKITELSGNKPIMITLSGGNPAIQPFAGLIRLGHSAGYWFALETQGSIAKDWFAELDMLVLSPKPPSSGMEVDWHVFEECLRASRDVPRTVLKLVVFDERDFAFARQTSNHYPHLPVYLQPGNHTPPPAEDDEVPVDQQGLIDKMQWLVARVTADGWFDATVLPQLHVMLWGNKRCV